MTLSTRITKAIKVIHDGKIKPLGENRYQVEGTGGTRIVTLDPPYYTCTCPWGDRKWLGNSCYHAIAACGLADVDIPLEPEEVSEENRPDHPPDHPGPVKGCGSPPKRGDHPQTKPNLKT